ncbi:MAG: c-type cytochrome [Opitutaceae bacterium]|nr:c-type cytochrome [Opitutaceae bacterium]
MIHLVVKIVPHVVTMLALLAAPDKLPAQAAPLETPGAINADASAQTGQGVYEQHCAACHGSNGGGDGPAAVWLYPKPRHFNSGLFKIRSTPAGFLPTDDDLLQVITRGMPGSSMPSFTYLSEAERREVVQYVKHLTAYADPSGKRINFFEEALAKGRVPVSTPVPPEPPMTVRSLAQGQEIYSKMNCFVCHGLTGEGTGPAAPLLKDMWGVSLPPRDFNTGAFRGGHTGRDLYLRVATGLAGTPMPPYDDAAVSPEQRWALVHYVQSLRRKDIEVNDILAPGDGVIHAPRVSRQLPADSADPFWETTDPVRVPLNPLWPENNLIPAVAIRAVHDGSRVAILCTWRDPIANGAPVRVQDFQDAVALQFSMNGQTPFIGMGDKANAVNIWQWKAGWQQERSESRQDVDTVYVSMHSDLYFRTDALYRTAEAAGNLLAQPAHVSPIEDGNARGFGTFTSQPASGQNVTGWGIWRDSHWSVVFVRELQSGETADVQFAIGKPVPVALAVWDGQNRDRNGRKVVSNWYQLALEP